MKLTGCNRSSTQSNIYTCKCLHYNERSQINNLILHLKELEKEQTKLKASWRKEVNKIRMDFPGGSVVNNSPAHAGDMGLIPDLGRTHMLQGI